MTQPPSATSATGDHLDLEAVADVDEGIHRAQDEAEAHLAGCERCRSELARIRSTRALLSTLPSVPMPAPVARRIDEALAGTAPTVVPMQQTGRRRWRSHPTAAGLGAAAAVVALVAAVVLGTTLHRSSSPSRPGPEAAGAPAPTAAQPLPTTVSGATYTTANVTRLVTALIRPQAGSGAGVRPGTGAHAATQPDPRLRALYTDAVSLRQCISALTAPHPAPEPIAIDFAHFTDPSHGLHRVPALVIVLPGLQAGRSDAWIVGPQCATAPDNNLYRYQSVPAAP